MKRHPSRAKTRERRIEESRQGKEEEEKEVRVERKSSRKMKLFSKLKGFFSSVLFRLIPLGQRKIYTTSSELAKWELNGTMPVVLHTTVVEIAPQRMIQEMDGWRKIGCVNPPVALGIC